MVLVLPCGIQPNGRCSPCQWLPLFPGGNFLFYWGVSIDLVRLYYGHYFRCFLERLTALSNAKIVSDRYPQQIVSANTLSRYFISPTLKARLILEGFASLKHSSLCSSFSLEKQEKWLNPGIRLNSKRTSIAVDCCQIENEFLDI